MKFQRRLDAGATQYEAEDDRYRFVIRRGDGEWRLIVRARGNGRTVHELGTRTKRESEAAALKWLSKRPAVKLPFRLVQGGYAAKHSGLDFDIRQLPGGDWHLSVHDGDELVYTFSGPRKRDMTDEAERWLIKRLGAPAVKVGRARPRYTDTRLFL